MSEFPATAGRRPAIRLLVLLVLATVVAGSVAGRGRAEGSAQLYPSNASCTSNAAGGSCRANIEWRTDAYLFSGQPDGATFPTPDSVTQARRGHFEIDLL